MTTVTQGTTSSFTFTGADSITFTIAQGNQARVSVLSLLGLQKYGAVINGNVTIGPFATGDVLSVTAIRGSVDFNLLVAGTGAVRMLTGNYTLAAADDQQQFSCTTALTISVPDGLSPRPTITVVPPPTGNLSVAMLGTETVNGATSTLTRTRSTNPCGVVLLGYRESAAYGLSGS